MLKKTILQVPVVDMIQQFYALPRLGSQPLRKCMVVFLVAKISKKKFFSVKIDTLIFKMNSFSKISVAEVEWKSHIIHRLKPQKR